MPKMNNDARDHDGLPRWAERGRFRVHYRYEGPAEMAKSILSGRWDFRPEMLQRRVNFYDNAFVRELQDLHVNWAAVVWAPGFSHAGDAVQWEIVRELIQKFHRRRMKVTTYLSLTNTFWQEMFVAEPSLTDCYQRQADGEPVPYMAATYTGIVTRYLMCLNRREWRDYIRYKLDRAIEAGTDSFFFDNIFSRCFCDVCREKFRAYSREVYGEAYEMPAPLKQAVDADAVARGIESVSDAVPLSREDAHVRLARNRFWYLTCRDALKELREHTRQLKPDLVFLCNAHERPYINDVCNFILSEDALRPGTNAEGHLHTNVGLWKYLFEDSGRWKPFINGIGRPTVIPDTPRTYRLGAAEQAAYGGNPYSVRDAGFNRFVKEQSRLYTNAVPMSKVGVLVEDMGFIRTRWAYFALLARRNIMFDILILEQLGNYRLNQYKAIVCRDVKFMPDDVVDMLRKYVRKGGTLIADHWTSRYNDRYLKRDGFALGDVLDISRDAVPEQKHENRFGRGRSVYYPQPIADLLEADAVDAGLIEDFIGEVRRAEGTPPVTVEAPDGLLVNAMRKRGLVAVHLLNFRNERVQEVRMCLPGVAKAHRVLILAPDREPVVVAKVTASEDGLSVDAAPGVCDRGWRAASEGCPADYGPPAAGLD